MAFSQVLGATPPSSPTPTKRRERERERGRERCHCRTPTKCSQSASSSPHLTCRPSLNKHGERVFLASLSPPLPSSTMAEVADLLGLVLSLEEADEDHQSETLDPAPLQSLAPSPRGAASDPSSRNLVDSDHDLYSGSEFPEDEVMSLALDLFDQADPFPEPPVESNTDDLGLALGLGSRPVFEIQEDGDGGDGDRVVVSEWGVDEFLLGRRSSASLDFSRARSLDNDDIRVVEYDPYSDSDEQIVSICADSDGIVGASDPAAEEAGLPLCWDSLRIDDDRRDPNGEFEWEEVEEADELLEEREFLSMMFASDEEAASVLTELHRRYEEDEEAARNIEWEVLLAVNNFGRNPIDHEDAEFADDGFVYTSEFEVLVGQFPEHDSSLKGTPPAAKLVVENLPSVVLMEEDIANKNITCAVCKDEIPIKERVKKLPCSHHYHEECILPWLRIRNTCPLCRFELPTDDPEYEKWKAQRAGNEISEEEARVRYEYEILPEV